VVNPRQGAAGSLSGFGLPRTIRHLRVRLRADHVFPLIRDASTARIDGLLLLFSPRAPRWRGESSPLRPRHFNFIHFATSDADLERRHHALP
jgi:hypothetical protein